MAQANASILVVDDELSMRELLDYLLSREGYRVSLAENGRSAAKLIEKNDFDLLLCDIKLDLPSDALVQLLAFDATTPAHLDQSALPPVAIRAPDPPPDFGGDAMRAQLQVFLL